MKNLLLLAVIFLTANSLTGQSRERDRNLVAFSQDANAITQCKCSIETKEARMMKLCSEYMEAYSTLLAEKELESIVGNLENTGNCSKDKVRKYLNIFHKDRVDILDENYIRKIGDRNKDCALGVAIDIYQILGKKRFNRQDVCQLLGCDLDNSQRVKSRGGEETLWKYTGEKAFVADEGVFGWRYRCIVVKPTREAFNATDITSAEKDAENNRDNTRPDEEEIDSEVVKYEEVHGVDPEWKKKEAVDIWED
jgi:hypothetical protein